MKKIVIFNQKGGTGKSTCTVNIAGILDKIYKKRVLIIDCDPQINSTLFLISEDDCKNDITNVLRGKTDIKESVVNVSLVVRYTIDTGIDVLPGSREVDSLNIKNITIFKEILKEVEDKYDYCIFDCPPHISNMTLAALSAADYVLVPALADTDSLCGYDLLIDTVSQIRTSETNVSLRILGIFFNNVEINKALEKYIISDCKENMGDIVFKSYIRRSSAVSQARYYGKPLCYYRSTAPVTKDFENLTKEIMNRIKKR